jgi:hypothetical protein
VSARNRRTQFLACLAAVALLEPARGQGPPAGPVAPPVCSLDDLARLSWCELEALYRSAGPAPVPDGFVRGRAFYPPDEAMAGAKAKVVGALWRGKDFRPAEGVMVNQWRGLKAIRARVCYGPSWLDGGPSLVLDYQDTSRVWSEVRDEVREVAPGLYLGIMYRRRCPHPQLKCFFALQACCP